MITTKIWYRNIHALSWLRILNRISVRWHPDDCWPMRNYMMRRRMAYRMRQILRIWRISMIFGISMRWQERTIGFIFCIYIYCFFVGFSRTLKILDRNVVWNKPRLENTDGKRRWNVVKSWTRMENGIKWFDRKSFLILPIWTCMVLRFFGWNIYLLGPNFLGLFGKLFSFLLGCWKNGFDILISYVSLSPPFNFYFGNSTFWRFKRIPTHIPWVF